MMTTEDLIAKLALRLEWTNAVVSEALKVVIEVLKSELLENNSVTIDDFGDFSTVKQSEYILIDRETKERYLMPPAVEVVFESPAVKPDGGTTSLELCFTPDEELKESVNSYFAFFEPTLLNEGVEFPGIPKVIAEENQEIEPDERIKDIKQAGQVENDEQPEQVEQIVEQEFVEQVEQAEPKIPDGAEKTERPQRTKSSGPEEKWYHRPDRKSAKRKRPSALWIPIMGGVAIAVAAYIFRQMTNPKK
jgi:nucleoid DNA-binding protein